MSTSPSQLAQNLHNELQALGRASDAALPSGGASATDQVDLNDLVHSLLAPYGEACTIISRRTTVPPTMVTTIALVFHEYATNSVKYGALGKANGNVTVRWSETDAVLSLTWIETGADIKLTESQRRGFGTELVERIVHAGGGRIQRLWRPEGLVVDLHLPIKH